MCMLIGSSVPSLFVLNRGCPDPDIGNTEETHCRDGGSGQYMSLVNTHVIQTNLLVGWLNLRVEVS